MNIKRHTYKYVKNYINKYVYVLLSKQYINARTKLEVQCSEGHTYKVTWNNFQRGKRCMKCFRLSGKGGSPTKCLEDIRKELAERGVELLSDTYKNNETLLTLKCERGHVYQSTWLCLQRGGTKCRKCQYEKFGFDRRADPKSILAYFGKYGYTVLNIQDYKNANDTKLNVMCSKGHKWSVNYSNFKH